MIGSIFLPIFLLQEKIKKSFRFLVQSNEFKNVFLTYYNRYCFYRTKNRPGRDNRSKIISVFPLAKAQCGNHPPQGSTADVQDIKELKVLKRKEYSN